MISATTVKSPQELELIHKLNLRNLKQNLSPEEIRRDGFVTWLYSMDLLLKMHQLAPSIIIKDNNNVIGYALVTLIECAPFHKDLHQMIAHIKKLEYQKRLIKSFSFYCMGQICIDKSYRGMGLVKMLYQKHKEIYCKQYELLLTEISTSNIRSINAHKKIGFKPIETYKDNLDEWNVVVWDWKEDK